MSQREPQERPIVERRLRAPRSCWWLPGRHLPTIWANGIRPGSGEVERIELDGADGDRFHVDRQKTSAAPDAPAVIVIPGLTGSWESPYVRSIASRLVAWGAAPYILNWRGYGGGPNRLPRTFHAADHVGLEALIAHIRNEAPQRPVHAIGFSLGGNMLAHALGTWSADSTIDRAWIIGAPYDLAVTALHLDASSRFYGPRLVRDLVQTVRASSREVAFGIEDQVFQRIRTFREYDDEITAPINGFDDADRYWREASARAQISRVTTPTTWIHADDDPIIPAGGAPVPAELPAAVEFVRVDRGGHLAFMTGAVPFRPVYWLEDRVARAAADRASSDSGFGDAKAYGTGGIRS